MTRYTHEYDEGRRSSSGFSLIESGLTLLGGLAIGAGLMYLLDPEEGRGRRKYIRKATSGALHSAGDMLGSAYESVADSASSLRGRAGDLSDSAGRMLRRSRDTARDYVEEYTEDEDEGMGTGMILSMVLGGSALAAVIYMLTTEYDSIRQGDIRGAATHAYQRASDAVSSGAQYVRETAGQVAERVTSQQSGGGDGGQR
jgi:hypothetical protein